jgi:Cdc6-like AAA superfamily ATPase
VHKIFFGYASKPELNREALHRAADQIGELDAVECQSWEDLRIEGRIVIQQILNATDECDLATFDVSTINENVLFEIGYAIGRGKRLWFLLDRTDAQARKRWKQYRLLSSVGYSTWTNSNDIYTAFNQLQPHLADSTIYDDLIEPNLGDVLGPSIFYVPIFYDTNASRELGRRLDREFRRGIRLLSADPTESSLEPLSWYAQKAFETSCTVVHFAAPRRDLAWLYNSRSALIAGLAVGLERPVLMLAEDEYEAPFDYQDVLRTYTSAKQSVLHLDSWLERLDLPAVERSSTRLRKVTALRGLRFGEHVAENERETLSEYFVETAAFDEVLMSRNTLFVGRKGTGKTANMLEAAARLSEDARNLVIVIKPASYEFVGLLALLNELPTEVREYTARSLWSFLLQSEIARAATQVVAAKPVGVPLTESERELVEFINESDFGLGEEFAVRFEHTVTAIAQSDLVSATTLSEGRDRLNEALHDSAIRRLRKLIGPVLRGRNRVAVLIDNLDKAWERTSDLESLARLLLGLLAAVGQVAIEYEKEDFWRDRVRLTLATFLRSDIYSYVRRVAREPDKIPTSVLRWDDSAVLFRVIEERFLAARAGGTSVDILWSEYFCGTVGGTPVKEYIAERVLPRPRDIVFFFNAAVISAVNERKDCVDETDIRRAEKIYSQFAFEALLVENGITLQQFEDVLYEFVGVDPVLSTSEIRQLLATAGIAKSMIDDVINRLRASSFLGIEVGNDVFSYSDDGLDGKKSDILARKLSETERREIRFAVHPAYRSFLEIVDVVE